MAAKISPRMTRSTYAPQARAAEHIRHPERTATRDTLAPPSSSHWGTVEIREWTNRAAMARTIRMQQQRAPMPTDWRPAQALEPTEGYA